MQGVLFRYGAAAPQVAFAVGGGEGGAPAAGRAPPAPAAASAGRGPRHLVLVSGLTEGLLFAPYTEQLARAAAGAGWSLVLAQLSSSYQGWGVGSLDADADELLLLHRHLAAHLGSRGVVLMGHSTGCQDAVRYCKRCAGTDRAPPLEGVILQAPVSDREWLSHFHPEVAALLPEAKAMVASGRGDAIVARAPADLGAAPLAAARLVALLARLGDDDMFSADLTDGELRALHGDLARWPLLLLQSGADECVPSPAAVPELGRRLLAAVEAAAPAAVAAGGLRRHIVIEGAPHNAAGHEEELAQHVYQFLAALGG